MNRYHRVTLAAAVAAVALAHGAARAEVKLPKVFGSHMVLQRDIPINVWGWANPNETVTVQLDKESKKAQANAAGEWKLAMPAMKAGGPYSMTVSGSSTVKFDDVLVGEVWICSGQSNMEMGIGMVDNSKAEIAAADYPKIRLLMVPNRWTPEPQKDFDGEWKACSPKTVAESGWSGFSAAGYFFGRELHKQLNVPIGLIDSTWGGTVAQSWTAPEGFAIVPALKAEYDLVQLAYPNTALHKQRLGEVLKKTQAWVEDTTKAMNAGTAAPVMPTYPEDLLPPRDVQHRTALFNGMIYPLCPFGIRGAIWYQGESNNGEGMYYTERMKALIGGWRKIWGEGEFPFYFVQIAPFNYGGNPATTAELWEGQAAAQSVPHTGMIVINDIGNLKDIHPTNKQEVGRRLALWALAKDYGKNVVCSGPTFKSMKAEGATLRVTFDNVGGGLKSRDGQPLSWFEIVDADKGGFVKAEAKIDGASVVLSSPEVSKPVAVRYAWSMLAEPNLSNAEGLPAGAFRAGEVPKRDLLALNVPESKAYELVYDLDLNKIGPNITYTTDNHAKLTRPFDRIGYFLELQDNNGATNYAWVSMDAFTKDLAMIGVPTFASKARFQQNVANMTVISNVPGVVAGTGINGGNIEFTSSNYGAHNAASVPNASAETFDFGDEFSAPDDGYGCMQVHNHDAKQTIFSFNHWVNGPSGADLGIGNGAGQNPDWTFASNSGAYPVKRLRVMVHFK